MAKQEPQKTSNNEKQTDKNIHKKEKPENSHRRVFITFVALSGDPMNLEKVATLEDQKNKIEQCNSIEELIKNNPGPVLRALLDKKSVLCTLNQNRMKADCEGPFQRVILLWNMVNDSDDEIRKRGELIKETLERFVPHLKGGVDVVKYRQPVSQKDFEELIRLLEELVKEERSRNQFVFLIGSGVTQTALAPSVLADRKSWRGRFIIYMYGETGTKTKWKPETLFNLFANTTRENREDRGKYWLRLMQDAQELDLRWQGFFAKAFLETRKRVPLILRGGEEKDRRWVAEAISEYLMKREGEWKSRFHVLKTRVDLQALYRVSSNHSSVAESSLHDSHNNEDDLSLVEQCNILYIPEDTELNDEDLLKLGKCVLERSWDFQDKSVKETPGPGLVISVGEKNLEKLKNYNEIYEWSKITIPICSNPYLISTAWRLIVKAKAEKYSQTKNGKETANNADRFKKAWCAPCSLSFVRNRELHSFCLEENLMDKFDFPIEKAADKEDFRPEGLCFLESLFDALHNENEVDPGRYLDKNNELRATDKNQAEWRKDLDPKIQSIFEKWWDNLSKN